MGDIVRDAEDTIRGAADTIFPGVSLIPDEYIAPIAAAVGSAIGGPVGLIIGAVLGSWLAGEWADEPDQQQFEALARGVLLNTEANDAPLPVVYGRRRMGGITILKETSDGDANLNKVVALCEGEIQQIQNVYFDQEIESTARFSGFATIERYLGTDTQAASTVLPAHVSGWTSAHQGKGVAYIYALLTFSGDVWRAEPVITADILGRKVYDPRVAGSPTVYAFSNNAVLAIRDYLTNLRFGRGIPDAAIDDTTFIASANSCDERVPVPSSSQTFTADASTDEITLDANTYIGLGDGVQVSSSGVLPGGLAAAVTYYFIPTGDDKGKLATTVANAFAGTAIDLTDAGTGTHTAAHIDQARYTCDGFVDTSRQPIDNVRALLTACRGYLYFSGGKWKIGIDQATAASGFVFDEDNIVGAWQIRPPGKSTRFNRAQGRFFNPAKQWQPDFAIYDNPTFRTEDNGLVLEATEVELPFTSNPYRAARIIQQEVRQSRVGIEATFTATIEALRCEVGDVVEITHTTPGWTLKKFRVVGLTLMSSDEVKVSVREYDVGVYSLDALSAVRTAPATNLPNLMNVAAPTNVTVSLTQDSNRVTVSWTAAADSFVNLYQVEYKPTSESTWTVVPRLNGTSVDLGNLLPDGYDIRVKSINTLGVASAYESVTHVIGSGVEVDTYPILASIIANTWTEIANPVTSGSLFDVLWDGSRFIAVGDSMGSGAWIITSPDGLTWTARSNPKNADLNGICVGVPPGSPTTNRLVAVGEADGVDAYIVTSDDGGVTWTERTNANNIGLRDVCWSESLSLYVAVGLVASHAYILTSPDGVTWTEQSPPGATHNLFGIAWSNDLNLFCAVGSVDFGSPSGDAFIITSPDGVVWTERSNPKALQLLSIVWSEDDQLFVAIGNTDATDAYIVTSPDGITWTERQNPKAFGLQGSLIWNGAISVGVGQADGTDAYIVSSSDSINWVERPNPKNVALLCIAWNGRFFLAAGANDGVDAYMVRSLPLS